MDARSGENGPGKPAGLTSEVRDSCPKCHKPNPQRLDHCAFCGIVFARYRAAEERRALRSLGNQRRRRTYHALPLRQMKHMSRFFRRLGQMLRSGVSLYDALGNLRHGKGPGPELASRLMPLLDRGETLIGALEQIGPRWPSYLWGHLEAGERSGHLPEMLEALANEIDARRKRIMSQIFNWRMLWFFAMLFFAAGSLAITGAVGNLTQQAIDQGVTGVLMAIIWGAIPRFLFHLIAFALICHAFAWFQIRGKTLLSERFPAFERFRMQIPLFSTVLIDDALARYFSLLSLLLESGLPLPKSLQLARADMELPHWRDEFAAVEKAIDRGRYMSEGFASVPQIPADLIAEIKVGESTGEIAEGMGHFVNFLQERVKHARLVINTIYTVALVLVGIILTLTVFIKGMSSLNQLYERFL